MPKSAFTSLTEAKKDKVIEKAKNIFSRKSIDEMNSTTIIKGMDISRGAFYMYFENKDDLYEYCIRDSGYRFYSKFKEEVANLNNLTVFDIINALFRFYTEKKEGINEYAFIKKVIQTIPDRAREIIRDSFIGEKTIHELYKYYSGYTKNTEYSDTIFTSLMQLAFDVLYESLREFYRDNSDVGQVRQNYKLKMAILKNGFAYLCHRATFFESKRNAKIEDLIDYDVLG